jgi:hypothetical protein
MEKLITLRVDHLRLNDLGGLVTDTISRVTPDVEALGDVAAAKLATLKATNDIRRKYSLRVPTPLNKDYTSVAPIPDEVHNGKHRTPLPRVFVTLDGELIELVFAVDFDVTYRNNVNVGTAHLYIHGKGKYTGTFVTTFQIVNAS